MSTEPRDEHTKSLNIIPSKPAGGYIGIRHNNQMGYRLQTTERNKMNLSNLQTVSALAMNSVIEMHNEYLNFEKLIVETDARIINMKEVLTDRIESFPNLQIETVRHNLKTAIAARNAYRQSADTVLCKANDALEIAGQLSESESVSELKNGSHIS